jgi:hypothetical protein
MGLRRGVKMGGRSEVADAICGYMDFYDEILELEIGKKAIYQAESVQDLWERVGAVSASLESVANAHESVGQEALGRRYRAVSDDSKLLFEVERTA